MHLVGFIIRIYHDARSPERQTQFRLAQDVLVSDYCVIRGKSFLTAIPTTVKLKESYTKDYLQLNTAHKLIIL